MTQSLNRRLRIPSFLLAVAMAAMTAILAGCGGSDDSGKAGANANAPRLDACQLFTYEDAKAIAGESLAGMSSTLDDARGRDPGQCIYNSGSLEQPRILSLLIRPHRNAKSAKRVLEASRSAFGRQVQDIPGIGDEALWVGGRIQQLHVLRGATELVITVDSPDGTDQLKPAREIAEKVLSRMGKA